MATMQVESNQETGNWCYVVRNYKNERIVATGDRSLALRILEESTKKEGLLESVSSPEIYLSEKD